MPTVEWNRRWGRQLVEHVEAGDEYVWGYQWGDPRGLAPLSAVVDRYITPFVTPHTVAMEIGPGGGRWTQFLVGARELVLVDLNPEFFPYLEAKFGPQVSALRFYQTQNAELDGIAAESIDFVFSFGAFVHIDPADIRTYLVHLTRVIRPGGRAVLQYADKEKKAARENDSFSNMNALAMQAFAVETGFLIEEHNTSLISHSNVIVLGRPSGEPVR